MNIKYKKKLVLFFFFSYFLIGVLTFKDYGINIEEQTQLYSGFYWLNYISNFFNLTILQEAADQFLIYINDPYLPSPEIYGPVFDVPAAFIDIFFNLEKENYNYEYRHFLVFILFFVSSIFVYKILSKRFNSVFIGIYGTSLYIFSPRIYGDSFHNNKDILFMSLFISAIFFAFKIFEKKKIKYIIIFSLLSAFATSTRVMGIFLPISLLLFLSIGNKNDNFKINLKYICFIILSYLVFLYLHWPYLWSNPIINLINFITKSKDWIYSYYILFNGKYFLTTNLPDSFIFTWIAISTPIPNLILFFYGYFFTFKRIFLRFTLVDLNKNFNNDFWRGLNEKKDLYIFFSVTTIISVLVFLNVSLVSGWRHLYFLNFYLIYLASFSVSLLLLKYKKNLKKIYFLLIILLVPAISKIIVLHPFQSLYLNELLSDNKKNKFLIDRDGLTSLDSLKKVISLEKGSKEVNLANASFLPYYRVSKALEYKYQKKLNFTGTDYSKADYIFNNFVYEVDPKYNDKYKIPDNFKLIYSLKLDGIKMYELYKKKY
jgi:hypothetical protein